MRRQKIRFIVCSYTLFLLFFHISVYLCERFVALCFFHNNIIRIIFITEHNIIAVYETLVINDEL